jgi:uncharacterized protein (DUF1330 family)
MSLRVEQAGKESGMAAYLVVELTEILDEALVKQYVEQAPAVVARYGGRYIARGPATVLEGHHQSIRIVLLEFPSMERLQAFYNADDYAPLKSMRQRGSTYNFMAVEGV